MGRTTTWTRSSTTNRSRNNHATRNHIIVNILPISIRYRRRPLRSHFLCSHRRATSSSSTVYSCSPRNSSALSCASEIRSRQALRPPSLRRSPSCAESPAYPRRYGFRFVFRYSSRRISASRTKEKNKRNLFISFVLLARDRTTMKKRRAPHTAIRNGNSFVGQL